MKKPTTTSSCRQPVAAARLGVDAVDDDGVEDVPAPWRSVLVASRSPCRTVAAALSPSGP